MKILFLDIDGVLNSYRTATAFGSYPANTKDTALLDPIAISLIRKLCKETNTKICLSSTWRYGIHLKDFAEQIQLPIIAATPIMDRRLSETILRGKEIQSFLESYERPIYQYAIVDDNNDMLYHQLPFFIQTDPHDGLSFDDYMQLKSLLK